MSRIDEIREEVATGFMEINVLELKERVLMPTEVKDKYKTILSEIDRLKARMEKAEKAMEKITQSHNQRIMGPDCDCNDCEAIADYRRK